MYFANVIVKTNRLRRVMAIYEIYVATFCDTFIN